MKVISIILGFFTALASILGSIFFVLFKQAKLDKKEIEEDYKTLEKINKARAEAEEAYAKEKGENEELKKKASADNSLNSFNANIDLLSK